MAAVAGFFEDGLGGRRAAPVTLAIDGWGHGREQTGPGMMAVHDVGHGLVVDLVAAIDLVRTHLSQVQGWGIVAALADHGLGCTAVGTEG